MSAMELVLAHDLPYRSCASCGHLVRPVDLVTAGEFLAWHRTCAPATELVDAAPAASSPSWHPEVAAA